jgi:antitoxin (DNA-binding transcriptional repressor) of toxin-antitoxin stability system
MMTATATMRDLRNHTREVIERAQTEAVTITDGGVPIAMLTALPTDGDAWEVDSWLDRVTGPDWKPYDSGLVADIADARQSDDEPDAVDRLGLLG